MSAGDDPRIRLQGCELQRQQELLELRSMSPATKFQQLVALMEARGLFASDPLREREIDAVRRR